MADRVRKYILPAGELLRMIPNLPADAQLAAAWVECPNMQIHLVIISQDYDPVLEGQPIPTKPLVIAGGR